MLERGAAAEQLTYLISTLNDLLTIRVIELELHASGLAGVRLCWLALGSEGRFEQTLVTDQDNGIVFAADGDTDTLRARLLPFAQRVNETLARCGFPLCKGGIMAGNPQWCLSVDEWRHRFDLWIDSGNPEALLHSTIFSTSAVCMATPRLPTDCAAGCSDAPLPIDASCTNWRPTRCATRHRSAGCRTSSPPTTQNTATRSISK
jgi:signal-transduction protein with cAMP-binding, CBS, and nucleotidyltransferase domain